VRVLVIWPPHVPSYFNAGHHLPVFMTAAYLRRVESLEVRTLDAGELSVTWKQIGEVLCQFQPDVVVIINDFDNIDLIDRLIFYCRELSRGCRVITGGRLSAVAPLPFRQFDLDAVIESGDVEAGAARYISQLIPGTSAVLPGVAVRTAQGWLEAAAQGVLLPAAEWALPDVSEIPYASYERIGARDQSKFAGIPDRRELAIPAARGCNFGCSFCDVPLVQGYRDRRISVAAIHAYIEQAQAVRQFDYISFYAPTFTFDRQWTIDLTSMLIDSPAGLPWKCATTMSCLDVDLLQLMAKSQCIRISVGVETLEPSGLRTLPRRKRSGLESFDALNEAASTVGIEMNYFVVLGLPGTTTEGARATLDTIRNAGARARPTVYASLDQLRGCTRREDLWRFNRQLFDDERPPEARDDWYRLFFTADDRVTKVAERIPAHRAVPGE
jgi:anaerobic magnesium-protoporphyrin IX monomethyl ester cyclase